jgi:hypothetical protein
LIVPANVASFGFTSGLCAWQESNLPANGVISRPGVAREVAPCERGRARSRPKRRGYRASRGELSGAISTALCRRRNGSAPSQERLRALRTPVTADGAGWPDLVLVRPPRIIFAELKGERGTASQRQTEWLDVLRLLPQVEVYLWHPNDWPTLVEVLTG